MKMIRINQIKIPIGQDEKLLEDKICKILRLKPSVKFTYDIVKKSIDARHKDRLMNIFCVNVVLNDVNEEALVKKINDKNIMLTDDNIYSFPVPKLSKSSEIIIAGSGPAGLFCGLFLARAGYCPTIFERGASIHERTGIVNAFWETGVLDTETNVQFGEGGAGTFSDGKLNTVIKEKYGRIRKVLETFVEFGAPKEILYINKPHIGTDILEKVVYRIRKEIERLGGKVYFNSKITDLNIADGTIKGIRVNNETNYPCDKLILAVGHSARDTFEMLLSHNLPMEQKAFAVGMRLEHPQKLINEYMYGSGTDISKLPVADYKVTAKAENGHGVYSFCMCPGGYVVNASSEQGRTCTNGMSYSGRNGTNANSAIIVTVNPDDFNDSHVLGGMHFQRKLEEAAYKRGNGAVIYQLNEDFVENRASTGYGFVKPAIKGQIKPSNLREVLPEFVCESVIDGMKSFDKIIKGFNMPDSVFSGVESRTSSPVRMIRKDNLESIGIKGIYPCGEGAGYAGGITSAAVDGIKVAEAIAESQEG